MDLAVSHVLVSEHYWPGVAEEIVTAQAQRLARTPGWCGTILMARQRTAFGLYVASDADDVRVALGRVAVATTDVAPAWFLRPTSSVAVPDVEQEDQPFNFLTP